MPRERKLSVCSYTPWVVQCILLHKLIIIIWSSIRVHNKYSAEINREHQKLKTKKQNTNKTKVRQQIRIK